MQTQTRQMKNNKKAEIIEGMGTSEFALMLILILIIIAITIGLATGKIPLPKL